MCRCNSAIGRICGYHRRERCSHPIERRARFWQSNTAVCRACDSIVEWEEVSG